MFRPAPQPAVGAGLGSPQHHPISAANDATGAKRRGRYNWDGRFIGEPADGRDRPSAVRRVFLPVGGLALLAGVALGAFYVMHRFASDPGAIPVAAQAIAEPVAQANAAAAPQAAVAGEKTADGQDVAGRVASPGKPAASAPKAVAAVNMKVPAPDNARWGEATPKDNPEPAAAAQADAPKPAPADTSADKTVAASDVKDPQNAPMPAEAPKKLAYASPEPKSARTVDKAVTGSLPPAKEDTPPGVDPNLLSVPAKTAAKPSAAAADEGVSGGYLSTVKTDVRMHSGAANHTSVVGVIPDKATVRVLSCDGWCRVSYNGKQGFIFKSFLGHSAAAAVAKPAPAPAVAKPAPAPAVAKPAPAPAARAAPVQKPQKQAAPAQEPQKKTADATTTTGSTASPSALEAAGERNLTTRAR